MYAKTLKKMTQNGIFVKMPKSEFSTKVIHNSPKMWTKMWKSRWIMWKTLQIQGKFVHIIPIWNVENF